VYCLKVSMISGARYQRVATYCTDQRRARGRRRTSVMKPVSQPGSAVCVERARPKSQTLRSQLALSSRFEGWRSAAKDDEAHLEIAVNDVGRMHRLERSQGLIDAAQSARRRARRAQVLAVVVREVLRADDAVHLRGQRR